EEGVALARASGDRRLLAGALEPLEVVLWYFEDAAAARRALVAEALATGYAVGPPRLLAPAPPLRRPPALEAGRRPARPRRAEEGAGGGGGWRAGRWGGGRAARPTAGTAGFSGGGGRWPGATTVRRAPASTRAWPWRGRSATSRRSRWASWASGISPARRAP